jgi:hypothetical protein
MKREKQRQSAPNLDQKPPLPEFLRIKHEIRRMTILERIFRNPLLLRRATPYCKFFLNGNQPCKKRREAVNDHIQQVL